MKEKAIKSSLCGDPKNGLIKVCLIALVIVLPACSKKEERSKGSEKPEATKTGPESKGGQAQKARKGAGGARDGKAAAPKEKPKVGSPRLYFTWTKEVKDLNKQAGKAKDEKKYAEAIGLYDQAIAKQPENLDMLYKRAYLKALNNDQKGALADVESLLLAHFPKYLQKVAEDKDFDNLKKPPHQEKLKTIVEQTRKAHVEALKKAVLFIGGSKRVYKRGSLVAGSQEIFGYVPETGSYIGVSYSGDANVLAFAESADRSFLVYVTAYRYVKGPEGEGGEGGSESEDTAFADAKIHLLDLGTGLVTDGWTSTGSFKLFDPKSVLQPVPAAAAEGAKEARSSEEAGDKEIAITLTRNNMLKVAFVRQRSEGDSEKLYRVENGKVQSAGDDPEASSAYKKSKGVARFQIRQCGVKVKLGWLKRIEKPRESLTIDGKSVSFACTGLYWESPSRKHVVFFPYRYCKNKPEKLEGLYLVDGSGSFKQLTTQGPAKGVLWLDESRFLAQLEYQVAYVDVGKKSLKILDFPQACIRAYAPHAAPCRN